MKDIGLPEKSISSLQEIFKGHPKVITVLLYGSRAKGTYKNGSDIDLTILGPDLSLTDLLKIENEIDNLLLPYKVDLSLHSSIKNVELLEHIGRVGIVFYQMH